MQAVTEPLYPDAKRPTVFQDGLEFQDFVCKTLADHGIILQNLSSKRYQFTVGENLQGFEIKLDNRCTDTGRVAIEVAEKSSVDVGCWTPSGIMRCDNSWLYIQGNYKILFVFPKQMLLRWYKQKKPEVLEHGGTIKRFFLSFDDAMRVAARVFDFRKAAT